MFFLFDSGWYSILILSIKRAMGECVCLGGGREGVLLNKQNLLSVCDKLFVHSPLPIYLKKNMQCYANINYVKNTQDTMLLIKNMKVNY